MYALPPGMQEVLQNPPFQVRCFAQVWQRPWPPEGGQVGAIGTQLKIPPLWIESGTVTIDNTGVQRRRANFVLTIPGGGGSEKGYAAIMPTSVNSPLTPFRNYLQVWWWAGSMNSYPDPQDPTNGAYLLGLFTITDVEVDATTKGDITLHVSAQDWSQDISRRVLTYPYVTQNGTNMVAAVQQMIQHAAPHVVPVFSADATNAQTSEGASPGTLYAAGYTWDEGQDPWEACQQMVEACGMMLYFGPAGVLHMVYIPNPASTPVCWVYAEGSTTQHNNITSITRTFSQSQVFNFVEYVVEGANANPSPDLLYTGTSFLAQIGDTDPTSPTYQFGPYGVAADVQFDMINYQQSTALTAAKARLRRDLGAADMVTFTALPNPAHEAYDVIQVYSPRIGLSQKYVIDTIDFDLGVKKDMSITARRVVNVP